MAEPTARVCPRCGTLAGEGELCSTCGTNLAAMRDMLPTRAEWEAANLVSSPAGEPQRRRRSPTNTRNQIIASIAVIALFALILLLAGSNGSHQRRSGSGVPKGAGSSSTSTPTATIGLPTVTACAAAWNGGRSAEHRRDLARAVMSLARPVAVIGTYVGTDRHVARVGGGNPVVVKADACLVAANDDVFLQQPDGSWGLTLATGKRFSNMASDPTWTVDHANATVRVGSSAGEGAITPARRSLVILTASQLER